MRGWAGFSSNWGCRIVYLCSSEKLAPYTTRRNRINSIHHLELQGLKNEEGSVAHLETVRSLKIRKDPF
jgi:hypothetical protein